MEAHYDILREVSLFAAIDKKELDSMLGCLNAEVVNAKKNEIVLLAGERLEHVGIVLAGQLHIVREDYDGNRTLVTAVMPGDVFGEAICCAGVQASPVSVLAESDATLMLLQFDRILHTCPRSCAFHTKLIENMLGMIARKNLLLQSRMNIIAIHSIREKVLRYLGSLCRGKGQRITIPFNREELADFLCVERTALSHELSRMKKDSIIDYKRNEFVLLKERADF